nr:AT4G36440-like protein [Ipomoea batatas]
MTLALHALGSNGLIPLRLSLLVTRTIVELAIPCDKPGKRVFEGFTVGFHLQKWEIRRLMRLRMIRKELLNANDKVMIPSYNLFTFYCL